MSACKNFPPEKLPRFGEQMPRLSDTHLYIAAFVVFFVTAALRFFMLSSSEYPAGLDGYYYALQAKSLVMHGALENPSAETGFYACALCSLITKNAVTGCKLWAAISNALIPLSVFVFLETLFRKKRPLSLGSCF